MIETDGMTEEKTIRRPFWWRHGDISEIDVPPACVVYYLLAQRRTILAGSTPC